MMVFVNLSKAEAGVGMMCSDGIPIKYCVSFLNANKQKPNIVFGFSREYPSKHFTIMCHLPASPGLGPGHQTWSKPQHGAVTITGSPGLRDQDKDAFPRSLEREVAFTTANAIIQPNKDFYLGS